MIWAFKIEPGEKHADYLPRLREYNKLFREAGMDELRAIQRQQQADRDRLRAILSAIPDKDDRDFAIRKML